MEEVVHLRIKKEYAAELIEDLIRAQALEPVEDSDTDIPEWQKEAVRNTLRQVEQHPEQLQSWEVIKQKYQRP
ncbi:MAG: hypothetical protein LCH51_11490 [Bacteroidetes bacterium]|nr:hypothetical protein [Bacteroidota bacterium]